MHGDALAGALRGQPWDPSVKSLVGVPQVLQQMNDNLEWTEQLGDAFLAQQGAVMDSIQRLRHRAASAGTLKSAPQQTVSTDGDAIQIQPPNPEVVYVPYYDPGLVYGPWPWPDYPPFYFYFPQPADFLVIAGGFIGFGLGFPILGPFWGWYGWDWHHHVLGYGGYGGIGGRGGRGGPSVPWVHDPGHRRGVPYRDAQTISRFQGAADAARRDVRGYPSAGAAAREAAGLARGAEFTPRAAPQRQGEAQPQLRSERAAPVEQRAAPVEQRAAQPGLRAPPAFQSFSQGAQTRGDSARGASSRATMPSAPSRGGGGGGGGGSRGGGGGRPQR